MTNFFTAWLLPRDEAFIAKSLNYLLISNVIWGLMFFVLGYHHPIPAALDARIKKPYDRLVLRHRLVCIYHGIFAWALCLYWHLQKLDLTCGKTMSNLELTLLVNTFGHFTWDMIFMKYNGFLDTGNLIHHCFGLVTYAFTFY